MRSLLLLTICIAYNSFTFSQTSLQAMDLDYGPYPVGYRYEERIDSSRTYQLKNAHNNQYHFRPIPMSIWYPAQPEETAQPMSILNYLEVLKAEEEWEHLPNEFLLDWFHYLWNTPENQAHLPELCKAEKNANPLESSHPVVVYAPSYQASSIENFAICEYLASHGFVVISSPSRGTQNKNLSGGTTKDMETQSRDVEFLLGQMHRYPFINMDQVVLMGFSFGGLSNTITVMKHGNIKGLISLDGTERYNYPVLEASPYFDLDRLTIPYLHMAQKEIPKVVLEEDNIPEELNHKFQLYDSLQNAKIYRYRFHNLSHAYFSSFGILFTNRDPRQDKSDAEIMTSYKLISTVVLKFLEAVLFDNDSAKSYLETPALNQRILVDLITKKIKQPKSQAFDYKNFNDLALKQNFDDLIPLYQSLKAQYPDLELQEGMLNILGLHMAFDPDQFEAGIKVFELALYLYPKSANLYDSLAEAYLYNKDYEQARLQFKKSLELNPENQNAINRLKQLEE